MKPRQMEILRALTGSPTVPFREAPVIRYVEAWAAGNALPLDRDRAGNLFVRLLRGQAASRWVYLAHMDHPGFIVRCQDGLHVQAEFVGGVNEAFFEQARVRFHAPDGPVAATVEECRHEGEDLLCSLRLDAAARLPAGASGTWLLPLPRVRGRTFSAGACDDLAGVAAGLCALEELAAGSEAVDVTLCLTRAEEAGFIGCLAACEAGSIPSDALIVGIEASKAQPGARLGDGVVIRVGDRVTTFDPPLTALLSDVAGELGKADPSFRWTRQLMPGGVCESTALAAWGHRAAAVCLPLANYHNMGPSGRIAPERIHLDDLASLIRLLAALPAAAIGRQPQRRLRERLEQLLTRRGQRLLEKP